jgi:CYTH domain-containing protein
MNVDGFEIERKYLIRMPDAAYLAENARPSQIEQTYLLHEDPLVTERVRRRGREGDWRCTHTVKLRVNDLRRVEDEREVGEEEYRALLRRADPGLRTIRKTRWVLPWKGQDFEIDVFPFWEDRALMEIELTEEGQAVELPPAIEIVREVTADRRYSNAALARAIPEDAL